MTDRARKGRRPSTLQQLKEEYGFPEPVKDTGIESKPASIHFILHKHEEGQGLTEICLYPDTTLWIRHSLYGRTITELPLGKASLQNVELLRSRLDVLSQFFIEDEPSCPPPDTEDHL